MLHTWYAQDEAWMVTGRKNGKVHFKNGSAQNKAEPKPLMSFASSL